MSEQKVLFSINCPQTLFDKLEEVIEKQEFTVSRSAFVVGLIEQGLKNREEKNSNRDQD